MKALVKSTRVFDRVGKPLTSYNLMSYAMSFRYQTAYLYRVLHQICFVVLQLTSCLVLHNIYQGVYILEAHRFNV